MLLLDITCWSDTLSGPADESAMMGLFVSTHDRLARKQKLPLETVLKAAAPWDRGRGEYRVEGVFSVRLFGHRRRDWDRPRTRATALSVQHRMKAEAPRHQIPRNPTCSAHTASLTPTITLTGKAPEHSKGWSRIRRYLAQASPFLDNLPIF